MRIPKIISPTALLVFSGLLTASSPAQLLISEYIDANTSRGAIEFWNASGTNITFGTGAGQLDARLQVYADGSASPTATIILTPGFTLQTGRVFVLSHSAGPYSPISDQVSASVSWTGDDAIVLRLGSGAVLDSIGQVGFDPGIEWGTGNASTADNTLRRKFGNTVADTNPNDAYDPAPYFDGYPLNNAEHLGLPPVANTLPGVATLEPVSIGSTDAMLNGQINSSNTTTMMWFDYGSSTNYGNSTPPQTAGSGQHGFQHLLTGLTSGATYHYRAAASNSLGVVFGTNVSFSTIFSPFLLVTNLSPIYAGNAAWADYDNDGRLDLTLFGVQGEYASSSETMYRYKAELWRNVGTGFNEEANFGAFLAYGVWGDADNDGWLDLFCTSIYIDSIAGEDTMLQSFHVITTPSDPSAMFFPIQTGPPIIMFGRNGWRGTWGDYNNDGKQDAAGTLFYRNTGTGLATNGPAPNGLAWWDFDNDGKLDFAAFNGFWRNTGNGFTAFNSGFSNLSSASFAWGDYDSDGRADLLAIGRSGLTPVAQLWRNSGSGFTHIDAGLTGFFDGACAWADYDNDGRLDIFLSGRTNELGAPTTELWRNTASGFTKVSLLLPSLRFPSVAWGDYDNDGRLDLFFGGSTNSTATGAVTQVWRNNSPQTNTPPSAPSGLSAILTNGVIAFTWNSASDSQTPAPGLTYNMRAGTTPGGIDIVSPLSANNGWRRIPAPGNRGQARIWIMPLTNLALGTPVYWSVQAVDGAFAGSSFAQEHSFRVLQATPPPPNPPLLLPVTSTTLAHGDLNGDGVVDPGELSVALGPLLQNSPFLQMTNVAGLGSSNVTFALTNAATGTFTVEASTNLLDWEPIGPAVPRYEFIDTNAPLAPQRSYRLRWP